MSSVTAMKYRKSLEYLGQPVACDVCGSDGFKDLGTRNYSVTGQTTDFLMKFEDAQCAVCGFVCEKTRPSEDFLYEFYADAHDTYNSVININVDYDVEARLEPFHKYLKKDSSVIEVGAGAGHFCTTLIKEGYQASGFDPKRQESREALSTGFVKEENVNAQPTHKVDAVVSYYVMEHVRKPAKWLQSIAQQLKPGGMLIIEVPNYETHPYESLNFEHMSHFAPAYMKSIFEQYGFEVSDKKFTPSRYFGFVMIGFLKQPEKLNNPASFEASASTEAFKAKAETLYQEALRKAQELDHVADSVADSLRDRLNENSSNILLWAVNDYSRRIVERLPRSKSIYLLDNAESKIGQTFYGVKNPVISPIQIDSHSQHKIFVLCSPSANEAIRKQIMGMGLSDYIIIDGTKA